METVGGLGNRVAPSEELSAIRPFLGNIINAGGVNETAKVLSQLAVGRCPERTDERRFTRFTTSPRRVDVRRTKGTRADSWQSRSPSSHDNWLPSVYRTSRIYFRPGVGGRINLNSTGRGTSPLWFLVGRIVGSREESRETVSLAASNKRAFAAFIRRLI